MNDARSKKANMASSSASGLDRISTRGQSKGKRRRATWAGFRSITVQPGSGEYFSPPDTISTLPRSLELSGSGPQTGKAVFRHKSPGSSDILDAQVKFSKCRYSEE
jgi:hypothetical protein